VKLRFSLRALLVVVTLAVAFCVWRERPRRMANRFVEAVKAAHYQAADELCAGGVHAFVVRFMERDNRNQITAERQRQTPGEWLKGECRVAVNLEDFSGLGASISRQMTATSWGIERHTAGEFIATIKYAPDPIMHQDIRR